MKKNLSIFLAIVLSAGALSAENNIHDKLSFTSKLGFASEYVHRGRKLGQGVADCDLDIAYHINEDVVFHIGGKIRQELESAYTTGSKINAIFKKQFQASFSSYVTYIMLEYKINDMFTGFAGYSHFYYPKMQNLNDEMFAATSVGGRPGIALGTDAHANEIFVGGWANILFRPTIKMTYNIDYQEFVVEGHAFVKKSLSSIGLPKLTFFMDNYLGFDRANKPYGISRDCPFWDGTMPWGKINGRKGYVFFGTSANLVYSLKEDADLTIGVNYSGNTNTKRSWTNFTGWGSKDGVRNMIWWNASANIKF